MTWFLGDFFLIIHRRKRRGTITSSTSSAPQPPCLSSRAWVSVSAPVSPSCHSLLLACPTLGSARPRCPPQPGAGGRSAAGGHPGWDVGGRDPPGQVVLVHSLTRVTRRWGRVLPLHLPGPGHCCPKHQRCGRPGGHTACLLAPGYRPGWAQVGRGRAGLVPRAGCPTTLTLVQNCWCQTPQCWEPCCHRPFPLPWSV